MIKANWISALILFFTSLTSYATTWDEPWKDKVIKEAESFVYAEVKSSDEHKGVTIEIIRTLAGVELKGKIKITSFYLLNVESSSEGHGPEFHFENFKECYFFIKKNEKGKYCIATPTTGFDYVREGKVYATYRHSYHQALVTPELYEKTMTAIFNNYHNLPYEKEFIESYVKENLSKKPAGFNAAEIDNFFAQHVALECIYHLRLQNYYAFLPPFLKDTANFHNQVSAARAMIAYNTDASKEELMTVIKDGTRDEFVKVICIWTLAEFKPKELKEQLSNELKTASTKDIGFGGNIMDPRVGTHFPSVKQALEELISTL